MKAVVVHQYGDPEVLKFEDHPNPVAGRGEVLVRLAGTDWSGHCGDSRYGRARSGRLFPRRSAVCDGGGHLLRTLCSKSRDSGESSQGTRVDQGGSASAGDDDWQPTNFRYRDQGRTDGSVVGAVGNVGRSAVFTAKQRGAVVIAGALKTAVLDTVGGETQHCSFRVLKPGGILVSSVSPPQSAGFRSVFLLVDVTATRLGTLARLLDSRKLIPEVGTVLPLEEARMAHEMLAGAPHERGKIVLTMHGVQ